MKIRTTEREHLLSFANKLIERYPFIKEAEVNATHNDYLLKFEGVGYAFGWTVNTLTDYANEGETRTSVIKFGDLLNALEEVQEAQA